MIELTARCLEPAHCPFAGGHFCENEGCAVESDEVTLPCSVTEHEKRLRRLACVVSDRTPVQLHHTRGGSIAYCPFGGPGVGQKQNPALQIPLHQLYHVGPYGIDARISGGVQTWERMWKKQTEHLAAVGRLLHYSPWWLAWSWASPLVRRRVVTHLEASRSRFFAE